MEITQKVINAGNVWWVISEEQKIYVIFVVREYSAKITNIYNIVNEKNNLFGYSIYSCECHGHGFTCDPVTGEKCNCGNNTESEPSCTSGPMKTTNMGGTPCWMVQCSKCRENYAGTPTMGHQCYKTVTVDNKMCFDSKLIGKFILTIYIIVLIHYLHFILFIAFCI